MVPGNKVYLCAISTGFLAGLWEVQLEDKRFGRDVLLPKHARTKEACAVHFHIGEPELYSEAGLPKDPRRLRHPRELIDPAARRLILVVSDCVAKGWRKPAMFRAMMEWAQRGPVVLVQVLPERLSPPSSRFTYQARTSRKDPCRASNAPNSRTVSRQTRMEALSSMTKAMSSQRSRAGRRIGVLGPPLAICSTVAVTSKTWRWLEGYRRFNGRKAIDRISLYSRGPDSAIYGPVQRSESAAAGPSSYERSAPGF